MPNLDPRFLKHPIAHRGLHDAENGVEENSRAAFAAAVKSGYCIELDLQLSADGEAMVFHDYNMTRLTGVSGPIQLQKSDDLKNITLLNGGENIPTLSDVLDLVDGHTPLLVEIKDQDGACGPNVGRLEKRVADLLSRYQGPVAVMSFNPHSMIEMSKIAPSLAKGLTTDEFSPEVWSLFPKDRLKEMREIPDFDTAGCSFISHNWQSLDTEPVQKLKDRDIPIFSWTIRSEKEEKIARKTADNITFEDYFPENSQ